MTSYYSILSVNTNFSSGEWVGIGLLLSRDGHLRFLYSKKKLRLLREILGKENAEFLLKYFASLAESVSERSSASDVKWWSKEYLSYLARYTNNMVTVQEPARIDIPNLAIDELCERLFQKYIKVSLISGKKESNFAPDNWKAALTPKISKYVNIDLLVTPKILPTLIVPTKAHYMGRNGVPMACQMVDFQRRPGNLYNDLGKFIALTKALDDHGETNGQYFIVGNEPHQEQEKNLALWRQIREKNFLQYVRSDELEHISDFVRENGVHKYLANES